MDPIKAAIAVIEARKPGELFSYNRFAKDFSVVCSTLIRQHKRYIGKIPVTQHQSQKLSNEQEIELLQYIRTLTEHGLPPTRQMIQSFASTIAHTQVSISWIDQFTAKNQESLVSRWTSGMDRNRYIADSPYKYRHYFDFLLSKITEYTV
jgi:hypothetical protein